MTVTSLRFAKSETRTFADRHRVSTSGSGNDLEWNLSNRSFFSAFVVIAALLAVAALVLR